MTRQTRNRYFLINLISACLSKTMATFKFIKGKMKKYMTVAAISLGTNNTRIALPVSLKVQFISFMAIKHN